MEESQKKMRVRLPDQDKLTWCIQDRQRSHRLDGFAEAALSGILASQPDAGFGVAADRACNYALALLDFRQRQDHELRQGDGRNVFGDLSNDAAQVAEYRERLANASATTAENFSGPKGPSFTENRKDTPDSRSGVNSDGLRTERVTLEVTHCATKSIRDLAGRDVRGWLETFGASVRVVDEGVWFDAAADAVMAHNKLTAERDAAIRDLATAREHCEKIEARLTKLEGERDAALRERDGARADAEHDVREVLAFARLERDAAKEQCERLRVQFARLSGVVRAYVDCPGQVRGGAYRDLVGTLDWIDGRNDPDGWPSVVSRLEDQRDALKARVAELEAAAAPVANAGGEANNPAAPDSSPQPPRGWLTEEERALVESLRATFQQNADALRSVGLGGHVDNWERKVRLFDALLARSTAPRVKGPTGWTRGFIDMAWIDAIREAGWEVE